MVAGQLRNSNLQNLFVPIFHLNGIAQSYFPTPSNPNPPQDEFNADMARATYFTNPGCSEDMYIAASVIAVIWL